MDGMLPLSSILAYVLGLRGVVCACRDTYRSSNIVIQNSVINNGDGMFLPPAIFQSGLVVY
jgi:hypothetical protein